MDISKKYETFRFARAKGKIRLPENLVSRIKEGRVEKGDVLKVSELAGIVAAKKTWDLLPFCHPIPFDTVKVKACLVEDGVEVEAYVAGIWRTGYEMEALTAVSAALLNIYDMCKMYTSSMVLERIELVDKGGGKGDWYEDLSGVRVAVVVASDSSFAGEREDRTGPALVEFFESEGAEVVALEVVPDDEEAIKGKVKELDSVVDVIVVAGGTGISPRDVTPEALRPLLPKVLPGFGEVMRSAGMRTTPRSMLSRSFAGVTGRGTLVVAVPGSVSGAVESIRAVASVIKHALHIVRGGGH